MELNLPRLDELEAELPWLFAPPQGEGAALGWAWPS
jgi:hypothetical protein